MSGFTDRRSPAVAGQFYPGNPQRLQAEVERYLAAGESSLSGRPRALVVPHAGYQFSGATAGKAYSLLRGAEGVVRVLVVAPSHRACLRGASVGDYGSFSTPLGDIEVDVDACKKLLDASALISDQREAHRAEHALEVQLPFIQTVLPKARLVPLVCGALSLEDVHALAAILREHLWRDDTVWIISSDFTHFGRTFGYMPFATDVPKRLEELDGGAIDRVLDIDCNGFFSYVEETGATICGRLPIALLLAALEPAREEVEATLLEYTTSGKLTHDYEHSVSYASLAVTACSGGPGENRTGTDKTGTAESDALDDAAKQTLLELARDTIRACVTGEAPPEPNPEEFPNALCVQRACFVTLHIQGHLRGCIGTLEASEPLYKNVIGNARNAAFNDYRFTALSAEELSQIDIEISVLTPNVTIKSLNSFVVGQHGIILEKGRHRAVFLPQVAPEQGWDRETTMQHLSRKAGMKPDDWRHGAKFSVFEAIVFGEKSR